MSYKQKYLKYEQKYLNLKNQILNDQIASGCDKPQNAEYNSKEELGKYSGCMTGIYGNRKRNGQGKMTYSNGNVFEGEWLNDKIKDGVGTMTYKILYTDGPSPDSFYTNTYTGNFVNGKRQGRGKILINRSKYYYDGEWHNDMRHGDGVMINDNEDVFVGIWENDQMKNGTLAYGNSNIRNTPDWSLDSRKLYNGYKREYNKDLEGTYTGEFQNYKRHGRGKMEYKTTASNIPKAFVPGVSTENKDMYEIISFDGEWSNDKWKNGVLKYYKGVGNKKSIKTINLN